MKTCTLIDFMEELKPWLDKDHIRSAEIAQDGRLILYFYDGMKNVYSIDDCNRQQIEKVLEDMNRRGIEVKK